MVISIYLNSEAVLRGKVAGEVNLPKGKAML
jgi:hypothetical protein